MWNWLLSVFAPERLIMQSLNTLIEENKKMSANFDALAAQVDASDALAATAVTTLTTLVTAVGTLTTQIADLTNQLTIANAGQENPTAVDALTAKLKIASDALATAIAAVPAH